MNVSLGSQWEKFVIENVQSGRYQTAAEVLRDALRLLEQREQGLKRVTFNTKADLEQMLEEGIKELEAGQGIPGEVALKTLRERAAMRRRSRG